MSESTAHVDISPELVSEWLHTPDDMKIIGAAWVDSQFRYAPVLRIFVEHPAITEYRALDPVLTRHEDGTITADWGFVS